MSAHGSTVRLELQICGRMLAVTIEDLADLIETTTHDSPGPTFISKRELRALNSADAEELARALLVFFGSSAGVSSPRAIT